MARWHCERQPSRINLRSVAWDEQPRALSLRSLRNPPTGGSPLSENLCFGAAKVTSLSRASCREVATEPAALIVVTLGCSSLGLFLTDCIPVGWSSLGFGCFRRGISAEVWPRQCSGLTLGIGPSRSSSEGRGRRAHRKCGAALEDPGYDGGTCAFFAYSWRSNAVLKGGEGDSLRVQAPRPRHLTPVVFRRRRDSN